MANELSLIPSGDLTQSKYADDGTFSQIASASNFLPRLQLFGANSDAVKRAQMPMAHYGLVLGKDQYDDLGNQIDLLPISWRPKAMRTTGGGEKGDAPIQYYDPSLPEFKQIQQDSEKPDSGCMFGPEFLVYIPAARRYATFFMSSKTARRQAPEFKALIGKGATLKVQLIETARYTWHGPTVQPCLTRFEIPELEEIRKIADSFNNPDPTSVEFDPEKLEESSAGNGRER